MPDANIHRPSAHLLSNLQRYVTLPLPFTVLNSFQRHYVVYQFHLSNNSFSINLTLLTCSIYVGFCFVPLSIKVDKAESLSTRNGSHHQRPSHRDGGGQDQEGLLLPDRGGETEPRLAKLEEEDDDDDGEAGPPRHPSSAIARDSYARTRSTSNLGRDAAARLLQSKYRGYRLRRYGGGGLGSVISGTDSSDDQGERTHGVSLRAGAGGAMGGKCSVLDLEVWYGNEEKL